MQLSARGAQKTRDDSKKLSMYSKQWSPGDVLHVYYPIFWQDGHPEIAVGAVWGHNVSDIKALGLKTAFIPSTNEFSEDGTPIGQPDITYQFSQIAKVFINGMKLEEEATIEKKKWPSESARKEALKSLDEKYDTRTNMKAIKPIIGRAQYYISTEVVSIKIANGGPDLKSIAHTSAPLSDKVIKKLYMLMENPKFAPKPEDKFFEVEWTYPAESEKSASANAASPEGLTTGYHLSEQYPEAYSSVSALFPNVSTDSQSITRRATRSVDPNRVRAALTQYSFLNSQYLDIASEEDVELLVKNVHVFKELDLLRSLESEDLANKIKAALEELKATEAVSSVSTLPEPDLTQGIPVGTQPANVTSEPVASEAASAVEAAVSQPVDTAQTVQNVSSATAGEVPPLTMPPVQQPAPTVQPVQQSLSSGAPSIQDLLNNQNNMHVDDSAAEGMNSDLL